MGSNGMVKIKQSRNRPGVAQRVQGGLGSQISWRSAREGGEVSLTHRPPLPPVMFLVLIFTKDWVDPRAMVRSEGDMSLKNPVTPPGIDPGTVQLVAQRLNHYAIPGPVQLIVPQITYQREAEIILPSHLFWHAPHKNICIIKINVYLNKALTCTFRYFWEY